MIKYLVVWTVINTFLIPCSSEDFVDPYGRTYPIANTLAIACWDTTTERKEREFGTLEEAQSFIEEGKGQEGLEDFQLLIITKQKIENE